MKCEACGATNPEGMKFCGNCGRPLEAPQPSVEGKTRMCVSCGRAIPWDAGICMYCGYDYRAKVKKGTEGQLLTGGILSILAGFIGLVILIITWANDSNVIVSLYVLMVCCCVLGLIGGTAALARRWYPLAVLGSAAAMFNPAFFFAIPALILIAGSATRFKDYSETM